MTTLDWWYRYIEISIAQIQFIIYAGPNLFLHIFMAISNIH